MFTYIIEHISITSVTRYVQPVNALIFVKIIGLFVKISIMIVLRIMIVYKLSKV